MKAISNLVLVLLLAGSTQAPPPPPVINNGRVETLAPAGGLEAALRQARSHSSEPVWVAYAVPMVPGMGRVCCYSDHWKDSTCLLEGKNNGWGSNRDHPRGEQELHVLLRLTGEKVDEIRGLSADCQVDAGGRRVVWLGGVKPEESVAFLAGLARTGGDGHGQPTEEAFSTLALHRSADADAALEELAASRHPLKKREQALFWMGQTRGERGAKFLAGVIRDDHQEQDDAVREKAIFSLSQSAVPWAAATIIRTAQKDRSPHIRSQALFWLAQMSAPESSSTILAAVERDPDPSVRKQAVFALSQLRGGKAVSSLLQVARGSRDPAIRKEALFWLAQSKDPEALAFLDKVLND